MGQRVNIQYSIEIDELESEVARLIGKVGDEMKALAPSLSPQPFLSFQTVEELEEAQTKLKSLSANIDDVQRIIVGFLTYKLGPPAEEATEPQPHTDPPPSEEDKSTLRDQLNEYRKVLEHVTALNQPDGEIVDEELKRQKIEKFKKSLKA